MPRALIVDDSAYARRYHARILAEGGFEVVTAADGQEGLAAALRTPVDLVLTDLNMTGLDGYALTARLREVPEYAGVPIVIISSDSGERDRRRGLEAGATLYLPKPCAPELLLAQLRLLAPHPAAGA
ncbi:MAG: response regulator [Gemmatimonadales bacterium]|nr:response regulator [Gemmatimonadales bacterium]